MIVLLVIVALIVLLLVIPFGVSARYVDGEASVAARVLCFNIRLFPRAEEPKKVKKAQKPKKEKKPKEKPEKAPKKRPKPSPDELLQLLKLGLDALARFKRKLTVNRFMLHLVVAAEEDAFIVVVDGHGQRDLGRLLPDDILVEHLANFARRGDGVGRFQLVVRLIAVLQHVHAQADALIADAHARPLDHAVHFVLALAAERAARFIEIILVVGHVWLISSAR